MSRQVDTNCEAIVKGRRCNEPPPLTGGNMNLNESCEHCGKNLCTEHLATHRCRAKRCAKGEVPIPSHKKIKPPAENTDAWWKRAMRLRETLESVHVTLRGRSSLPLQARVDQCVAAITKALADAS